jgi:hypothetical protein
MQDLGLRIKIPAKTVTDSLVSPTHTSPNLLNNLQLAFKNKLELKIASSKCALPELYTSISLSTVIKEQKVKFTSITIYYIDSHH